MTRVEMLEWITMIAIILLWWPVVFVGWSPAFYRYPLYVVSAVSLLLIFRNRLRRLNEGFSESESMMEARRRAEDEARGGRPSLDEKQPPDVPGKLPFDGGRGSSR